MELVGGLLLPLVVAVLVGGGVLSWQLRQRRVLRQGLHRLAAREGLRLTDRPCGLDRRQLADRSDATPAGDRRYGLRHAVEGPVDVALDGTTVRAQLGCFQWWWEVRSQSDHGRSYQTRACTVAAVRLPVAVPGTVRIEPEGVLGRVGLRRADQQLESEEFNRRFHVRGSDPQLTVRFLDASMQHRLLTTATGRTVHLEGDVLLLGGAPAHRDPSLPGIVGQFPAAAQDLLGLLRSVPAQVWRTAVPVTGHGGAP